MMTTRVLLLFLGIMFVSGIGFASPLTDYSAGKVAIDLDWRNTQVDGNYSLNSSTTTANVDKLNLDKKYSLDGSITVGLGSKFAFQYNNFRPSGTGETWLNLDVIGLDLSDDLTLRTRLSTQQYNVLYQINNNFAVYTGVFRAKGEFDGHLNGFLSMDVDAAVKRDIWQLGLVGSTKLDDKITLYGILGGGKDLMNWAAGLSYEVTPDTEINLSYRKLKVDDFTAGNARMDGEASGFGLGVTYKF